MAVGNGDTVGNDDAAAQRANVAEQYAKTVKGQAGCCVSALPSRDAIGYSKADLDKVGGADLGVGCGTPVALARLRPGETVLDLGCGAGIDCLLASDEVGPEGRVIGVDMTPDMLSKARKEAATKSNVSFRLGEIEHLPCPDSSVDVVISNCVINLSPEKQQVMREIFRVLKPGGRLAIADVIARGEIPEHLRTADALACWVAGAPEVAYLEDVLRQAGFSGVRVDVKDESREFIKDWMPGSGAEDHVASANVTALKPARAPAAEDGEGFLASLRTIARGVRGVVRAALAHHATHTADAADAGGCCAQPDTACCPPPPPSEATPCCASSSAAADAPKAPPSAAAGCWN